MARRTSDSEKKGFKALFEVETAINDVKVVAQGTWANDDKEASLFGFINLIIDDFIAIKCSVVNGKGDKPFLSFPQNKAKDGKYYSQVVPMSKEIASGLAELAEQCADSFDKL